MTAAPQPSGSAGTTAGSELRLIRVPCPLCGGTRSQRVLQAGDNLCGLPGLFTVERCLTCRHLYMNPRPADECLSACYPDQYGPHQNRPPAVPQTESGASAGAASATAAPAGKPWYLRYLPLRFVPGLRALYCWLLDDRSQPLPVLPARVREAGSFGNPAGPASGQIRPQALEIGCSTGRYLAQLRRAGWDPLGIEPGQSPSDAARAAGLNVITGTLDTVPLPAAAFDLAAAWMVIEHVPDPRNTLTGLARVLRPGGQLLISIPNAGCWEPRVFGSCWYVWELPRHLHHFTPSTIRTLLTECGFENIRIIHQRSLLNVVGSFGILILRRRPGSRIGQWLKSWPDHPTLSLQLLLAPVAHGLAFLRQGGRLTITATRRLETGAAG